MKVTCPNNPEHNAFITVVHVTEDWVIDRNGNYIEVSQGSEVQVVRGPTVGNTFTCKECGAEAKAVNDG